MALKLKCTADYSASPDLFQTLCFDSSSDWCTEAAQEYINLRTKPHLAPDEKLLQGLGFDTKVIRECFKKAGLPQLPDPIPDLNVVRSDFGELISMMLLEQQEQFSFPYKSIRDRELTKSPGRSIDAIGAKPSPLTVVFNESKVSDEKSIPQVVDKKSDSLSKSLKKHIIDEHAETEKKLWDLVRRIQDPDTANLFTTVALYWQTKQWDKLIVIASAFMVRPNDKHEEKDFGNLRKSPSKLRPGNVAFRILCTEGTIDDTIKEFHQKAKGLDFNG